jgi:hypothetical protein
MENIQQRSAPYETAIKFNNIVFWALKNIKTISDELREQGSFIP